MDTPNMKTKIVVLFLAIELGIVLIAFFRFTHPQEAAITKPSASSFSFDPTKPPSQSLVGTIVTSAGEINWQSREATQTTAIKNLTKLQQGETIKTGATGTLTIDFKNTAQIIISGNSEVGITQTLPQNLVFNQTAGTVLYTANGSSPLSVRVFHLLAEKTSGEMSVTVDDATGIIIVKATEGDIRVGYNDTDLRSQTLTLIQGSQAIFNDETRKILVKKI